jgi:hypothetical protein
MRGRRRTLVALGTAAILAAFLAAFALKDRAVEEWHLWRLESGDPAIRAAAAERLIELRSVRGHLRLLEQPWAREPCVRSIVKGVEPGDTWRMPVLYAVLRQSAGEIRSTGEVLSSISPQREAARALVTIGRPSIPWALRALSEKDDGVRIYAAWVLSRLPSWQALPALTRALNDVHPSVRRLAASTIGRLGPKVPTAALEKAAAEDPDGDVRDAAASAIRKIRGEEAEE